jgi:hypothetical protein
MKEKRDSSNENEKMAEAEGIIREFEAGKPLFFETNTGEWKPILTLRATDSRGVTVLGIGFNGGINALEVNRFKKMQERAKEEGVAEYISEHRRLDKMRGEMDYADPSMKNKERIFEANYRGTVVEKVGAELLRGEKTTREYAEIVGNIENLAAGRNPQQADRMFPGWKAKDFVEMLKIFDQEEQKIRDEMIDMFETEEIDVKATQELIKRAQAAEAKLKKVGAKLERSYGVAPNPFG